MAARHALLYARAEMQGLVLLAKTGMQSQPLPLSPHANPPSPQNHKTGAASAAAAAAAGGGAAAEGSVRRAARERLLAEMLAGAGSSGSGGSGSGSAGWKVLVVDSVTTKVLSAALRMSDLQDAGERPRGRGRGVTVRQSGSPTAASVGGGQRGVGCA